MFARSALHLGGELSALFPCLVCPAPNHGDRYVPHRRIKAPIMARTVFFVATGLFDTLNSMTYHLPFWKRAGRFFLKGTRLVLGSSSVCSWGEMRFDLYRIP